MNYMRKTLIVVAWFPLTFILLIVNITLLLAIRGGSQAAAANNSFRSTNYGLTASYSTAQVLGTNIVAGDARALLIQRFLNRMNSPMASYSDLIVQSADEYGLDWRLTTAIAGCESEWGKKIPIDSFNPYGIAVYTGQKHGKNFDSWEHAISWATRYIREQYYNRGITDLKAIGAIWAPPSVNTNYSWSSCVDSYVNAIF